MSAKSNFVLDVAIAAAFLVASNPPLTGPGTHEWLGVSLAVAAVTHVLFHRNWVGRVTHLVFGRAARGSRVNLVVDVWLFVALTTTVLSGLLISTHLLASLGFATTPRPWWREIHSLGANALLVGMGVHVGLHWDWLAVHLRRLAGIRPDTTPPGCRAVPGLNTPPAERLAASAGRVGRS